MKHILKMSISGRVWSPSVLEMFMSKGGRVLPSRTSIVNIRKSLFGPVNHDEMQLWFDQERLKYQAETADKWGFDFIKEIPLDGQHRFTWERVTSTQGSVQDDYTLRGLNSGMPYGSSNVVQLTKQPNRQHVCDDSVKEPSREVIKSVNRVEKKRQRRMTDFLKTKKKFDLDDRTDKKRSRTTNHMEVTTDMVVTSTIVTDKQKPFIPN